MRAGFPVVTVTNEPVRSYVPGSKETADLQSAISALASARSDIPLWIDGIERRTGTQERIHCPHNHALDLGAAHLADSSDVADAVVAAKRAWHDWSRTSWDVRARIFLKAADLVAGPWRDRLNAATMLGQSKTAYQAEIDAAAELSDFLRFNVVFMQRLYSEQPISASGTWNYVDYRPLEGFVYAVSPFNFTAIAGNLPTAPALMGNTVIWKPSANAKLSAGLIAAVLHEAGLPDGVINVLYGDAESITRQIIAEDALAGIHFTGSTEVFDGLLAATAARKYRNYPRIVGETGGKNFTLAHHSADRDMLATAVIRGGYEYQGQKCSATSRLYVPRSLWPKLRDQLVAEIETIKVGDVSDFSTFMGAVIDERAWLRLSKAHDKAIRSPSETVVSGAKPDATNGYFVPPMLIETTDPASEFITREFFGPIIAAFVYEDDRFDELLKTIDENSAYGLTAAIFARDTKTVARASDELRYAAGNFYINDKSTGAVVGQQPFGGGRASGTNDKAGSMWNLARWVSPRTVKESWVAATDYRYPSMSTDAG